MEVGAPCARGAAPRRNAASLRAQNYVVLLDSTLPRSQYDYGLPQVSFAAVGYHKHVTLIFNPTVSARGVTHRGWRERRGRQPVAPAACPRWSLDFPRSRSVPSKGMRSRVAWRGRGSAWRRRRGHPCPVTGSLCACPAGGVRCLTRPDFQDQVMGVVGDSSCACRHRKGAGRPPQS